MIATKETEICIGSLDQIPVGEGREFTVNSRRIAVFHSRSGEVLAAQAECPHRGGPLADGLLGGGIVVCPLHARKFDLTSGRSLQDDCGITTYPARTDAAGRIYIVVRRGDCLNHG